MSTKLDTASLIDSGPGPVDRLQVNMWKWLSRAFYDTPQNIAMIATHQPSDRLQELKANPEILPTTTYLEWTYGDLERASAQIAAGLKALGVKDGDVLVTFLKNGVEFALAELTAVRLNIALAPLDPNMVDRPKELAEHLNLIKPTIMLAETRAAAEKLDAHAKANTVKLLSHGTEVVDDWHPLTTFATRATNATLPDPSIAPNNTAHILFTSGTTGGQPKGCCRTQKGLMLLCETGVMTRSVGPDKRYLYSTVNFRSSVPTQALICWRGGGTLVFCSHGFNVEAIIDALTNHGITNFVTTQLAAWAISRHPKCPKTFPALAGVAIVGDIVTLPVQRRAKSVFGHNVTVVSGFGMTEGTGTIGWAVDDLIDHDQIPTTRQGILSVGRALPGGKVKVANPETNLPVDHGDEGELHYCGDTYIYRYMNDRNPESFYDDDLGDHWFKSGDIGMMSEEGYLYVLGRMKDVLKCNAATISPAALEAVLNVDKKIEVRIIGLPDPELSEKPVAVVKCEESLRPGLAERLQEQVLQAFGAEKAIRAVYYLDDVGYADFPTNSMGKVLRKDLVQNVLSSVKNST